MKRLATTLVFLGACLFSLSGTAAEPTADDYKTFFDYLVGTWEGKSEETSATYTFKWMGAKCCVVGEFRLADGQFLGTSLDFYDPKVKGWHRQIVWAGGSVTNEIIIVPIEKLKGDLKDVEYSSENDTVDADGRVRHGKNVFRIVDRNHWKVKLFTGIGGDFTRK